MDATNFDNSMIPKINALLEFVYKNKHSNFYRKIHVTEIKKIKSYKNFQRISTIKKSDFADLDPLNISFVDWSKISYFSFSSGTTGNQTAIPFSDYNYDEFRQFYFDEKKLQTLGVDKIMTFLQPTSAPLRKLLTIPKEKIVVIPGDFQKLHLMASIAKELRINALIGPPSRILAFMTELEKTGFNLNSLKWISLGSEFLPKILLDFFKNKAPNATFMIRYGNTEIGRARAYQCQFLNQKGDPQLMHPTPMLIEIIGQDGSVLPLGEIGQLVHTDLETKAFPLLRYETGDFGKLENYNCQCGNKMLLTMEGRCGGDYLKIESEILTSRNINSALIFFAKHIKPRFEMHVGRNANKAVEFDLHLELLNDQIFDSQHLFSIEREIEKNLHFISGSTLEECVAQGKFSPLKITLVKFDRQTSKKNLYIISHLN